MKISVRSIAVSAVIPCSVLAFSAPMASAGTVQKNDSQVTSVSVIGGNFPVTLSSSDMTKLAQIAKNYSSGGVVVAAASPVTRSWRERDGQLVVLRSNIESKVVNKHNLTWQAVRTSTQYPKTKVKESGADGTTYKYETPVQRIECSGGWWIFKKCKVAETVTLRTIVNFRKVDANPMGVVTSYCVAGSLACPGYVKSALNVGR